MNEITEKRLSNIEYMNQESFEDMVIEIIKTNEDITSNVKAVQRYIDIENNVLPEDCEIDNNTSSLREGIWKQLVKLVMYHSNL